MGLEETVARTGLSGVRVLVTRADGEGSRSAVAQLRERGAEPVEFPMIEFHPPHGGDLERALRELRGGRFDWVVFTSATGVDWTWRAMKNLGCEFGRAKVATVGPRTAAACKRVGVDVALVAKEFTGEALASELISKIRAESKGASSVLIARAAKGGDALPDTLREAGCDVVVAAAYETRAPSKERADELRNWLKNRQIDVVMFTSGSTVDNMCALLGVEAAGLLAGCVVASIGPVTTAAAIGHGVRVDVTSHEHTVPGLLAALEEGAWRR